MSNEQKAFQNVAIAVHPKFFMVTDDAELLSQELKKHGVSSFITKANHPELKQKLDKGEFDLLIALGGDGTMLRAGHLTATLGLPLLGINLGRFGFLMQLTRQDWRDYITRLVNGDFKIENRMMLEVKHWRKNDLLDTVQVINEVVVCRGEIVRPIRIKATVDGYPLASYVADGLIAATPTGSTAYALAVGGPIMPPELRNILIVPVAPHLSMSQAVILPEGASVDISATSDHQAVMSVDGHKSIQLKSDDKISITSSNYQVKFVVFQDPGYFYRNLSSYMEQNPSIGGSK